MRPANLHSGYINAVRHCLEERGELTVHHCRTRGVTGQSSQAGIILTHAADEDGANLYLYWHEDEGWTWSRTKVQVMCNDVNLPPDRRPFGSSRVPEPEEIARAAMAVLDQRPPSQQPPPMAPDELADALHRYGGT
ncbi:DUF6292 family protein [Streptomyces sp. NPDC052496]|uniref:DUF6292 family protein n=1 Tax=Streptomyces sp. NPDC052496 TaxID=3154951 RepID=UPI0034140986